MDARILIAVIVMVALAQISEAGVRAFTPRPGDTRAYIDTDLILVFDEAPTLGAAGKINVYRASDNALADSLDISDALVNASGETQTAVPRANTEIDSLGGGVTSIGGRYRWVYYAPVKIKGNAAVIRLHDGKLAYNTRYTVTVDAGVFTGITEPLSWTFTTRAPPSSYTDVTVAAQGQADFRSVQGALDWIMEHCATGAVATFQCNTAATPKKIRIRNGVYDELLFLRNVENLTLVGEGRIGTRLQTDNFENYNPGTGGSAVAPLDTNSDVATGTRRRLGGGRSVFLVEGGDLLKLTRFTLRNTHVKAANVNNQAETIYYNSASLAGSRFLATFMNFQSAQDTIQTKGWAWFYRSSIEGDVDFIWGSPFAALFEQSELRTIVDATKPTSGGYIVQSRAFYGYPGFVVLESLLTRQKGVPDHSTYLARSGGVGTNGYCSEKYTGGSATNIHLFCDNVAYIRTRMGPHIKAEGWLSAPLPNQQPPTETSGWREYLSKDLRGRPLDLSERDTTVASHAVDLTGLDTRSEVFAAWNNGEGWTPTP